MNWFVKASEQQISKPFFRVVCPALYGGQAEGDKIGPGTYWTPRWMGVLGMLRSIFSNSMEFLKMRNKYPEQNESWRIKIYRIEKAVMADPPESHKWAFYYAHDAGEQVLVQALQPAQLLYDFFPDDPEFFELISEPYEAAVDYSGGEKHGLSAMYKGKKVYFNPNYQEKCVDVAAKNEDYSYHMVAQLYSLDEYNKFLGQCELPSGFDSANALGWFVSDMNWLGDQQEPEPEPPKENLPRRRRSTRSPFRTDQI